MSEHERIQEEIPAYVAQHLDAGATRALEVHLATCEECQDLVSCCEEIAAGIREESSHVSQAHPEPGRLRALAHEGISDDDVSAHVEHCASCALELASWRRGMAGGIPSDHRQEISPPSALRAWFSFRPLAVGAVIGAVLAVGVSTWMPSPGTPTSVTAWNGSPEILVLREATRGASRPDATVGVAPGQLSIPVDVELAVPPSDASPTDSYRFVVRAEDGSTALVEATVSDVRLQLREWGRFRLFLDAGQHAPGSYTLEIESGDAPTRERTFDVVRKPGH